MTFDEFMAMTMTPEMCAKLDDRDGRLQAFARLCWDAATRAERERCAKEVRSSAARLNNRIDAGEDEVAEGLLDFAASQLWSQADELENGIP